VGEFRRAYAVGPGEVDPLAGRDPGSTDGAPGDRSATEAATEARTERLADLQARLWAEGRRSLLVVLQGIDTSGKDGTISHVFRGLNPLGLRVASFKTPTDNELAHDFLWRVHAQSPAVGEIGIFNRSHYEDVLVVRVRKLVKPAVWRSRYGHINAFEALLADAGTTVVKVFLHLSMAEQRRRLDARLADPAKAWKVQASDFEDRKLWAPYTEAFEEMLTKTSTQQAPWFVVPADAKWFRNWVVMNLVIETLEEMDPRGSRPR
jgi:PPK2 family polyphosphate:nucleotide phosphotransferase